uniref:RING-type domain-containing protein n=2 Tax=Strongyloides stercoralis TaxID=6248 RepID=A0AAF5CYB3_STRER
MVNCCLRNMISILAFSPATFFLYLVITTNPVSPQFFLEIMHKHPTGSPVSIKKCEATGANFGADLFNFQWMISKKGCALETFPANACDYNISVPILPPAKNISQCDGNFFALVPRGNCSFSKKAFNVQQYYKALIVYQDEKEKKPISMSGREEASKVEIPVIMITYKCMEELTRNYSFRDGQYFVLIKSAPVFYDLIKYLIPFLMCIGLCFIVLCVSLGIRLFRERRKLAKKRLSKANLKKIPVRKYVKNEEPDTCAICLEDFIEGEKLRVLYCNHAYHCKCIDPWLTKNRKVCPICKRKVGPSTGDSSSDEETGERGRQNNLYNEINNDGSLNSGINSASTLETVPLLSNSMNTLQNTVGHENSIVTNNTLRNTGEGVYIFSRENNDNERINTPPNIETGEINNIHNNEQQNRSNTQKRNWSTRFGKVVGSMVGKILPNSMRNRTTGSGINEDETESNPILQNYDQSTISSMENVSQVSQDTITTTVQGISTGMSHTNIHENPMEIINEGYGTLLNSCTPNYGASIPINIVFTSPINDNSSTSTSISPDNIQSNNCKRGSNFRKEKINQPTSSASIVESSNKRKSHSLTGKHVTIKVDNHSSSHGEDADDEDCDSSPFQKTNRKRLSSLKQDGKDKNKLRENDDKNIESQKDNNDSDLNQI